MSDAEVIRQKFQQKTTTLQNNGEETEEKKKEEQVRKTAGSDMKKNVI